MTKPLIISVDECKKFFPKYNPKVAGKYHRESAKLADKIFEISVKIIPAKVVLLAGGSASGKTEYLSQLTEELKEGGIFYDGTLPNWEGAKIKIKHALKFNRDVEIHFILPDEIKRAYVGFLDRERQFDVSHFYRTHISSRKTILDICQSDFDIPIRIIENRFTKGGENMIFEDLVFPNQQSQIDFLESIQYNESELKTIIF